MAIKTQGTELWFINGSGALIKVGCVTSVSGISSQRDQIETTCLEDDERTYTGGLQSPGTAAMTINFDPSDSTHIALETAFQANTTVWWALGWGDGTSDPTVDSNLLFDLPTSRSWLAFEGYVSDLPFDFALNAVVASSISIQMSGARTLTAKST